MRERLSTNIFVHFLSYFVTQILFQRNFFSIWPIPEIFMRAIEQVRKFILEKKFGAHRRAPAARTSNAKKSEKRIFIWIYRILLAGLVRAICART